MRKPKRYDNILKDSVSNYNSIFAQFVKEIVCNYYDVDYNLMLSKSRTINAVKCRQISMYLIRKHTTLSLPSIGKMFNKNHATIIHSIKTMENHIEWEKDLSNEVDELEKIIVLKTNAMVNNFSVDKNLYFIDLNEFVSFKIDENKSIILIGHKVQDIQEFMVKNSVNSMPRLHKNKGMYILEKNKEEN